MRRHDRQQQNNAMRDFIFLMHANASIDDGSSDDWGPYLAKLQASGRFSGGSAIGDGICVNKRGNAPGITEHIGGYIRVQAESIEDAVALVRGNPAYEASATIEIRELPRTE